MASKKAILRNSHFNWICKKANKLKVLNYIQEQWETAKEMKLFQMLRKEVEIGKNGTQRYVIKKGPNKGKIVG